MNQVSTRKDGKDVSYEKSVDGHLPEEEDFKLDILLPGGKKELQKDGTGIKDRDKGIIITPEPGFVVKTYQLSNRTPETPQTKIFINVCGSVFVEKPQEKTKLDEDGNEIEGLNIPVAVGTLRECLDKSGKKARRQLRCESKRSA